MKRKFKFSYCLLQYEHNPWLKERLNIGVMVFGPASNFLRLKTRGWDGRILCSYPNIEKSNFTEDVRQIERTIMNFVKGEFKQPRLFSESNTLNHLQKSEPDLAKIGKKLCPDMDSSYRWVEGGVGICASLDEKLEELFHRFVASYDKTKQEPNRSDSQVWSTFSTKLSERNLGHFIEIDQTVSTDLGPVKFHAGYRNGALHVIQPLSFDLSDEDHISDKAARWAGYAQSVRSFNSGAVKPHFVIGRPGRTALTSSFDRAKSYLKKVSGENSVVTEENSEEFVDLIEDQMTGH